MSPIRRIWALAERGGFTPFQSKKGPLSAGAVELVLKDRHQGCDPKGRRVGKSFIPL